MGRSVTMLSDEETAARMMVESWCKKELQPHVRSMDQAGEMKPEILKSMFENGLMGMEIPEEFGGSGMNFTSACLAVEEVAKIDPSFAILVDIQVGTPWMMHDGRACMHTCNLFTNVFITEYAHEQRR